jgi:hypothetical protein
MLRRIPILTFICGTGSHVWASSFDEFAILQPDTDFADARKGLSKLREILCSETIANGLDDLIAIHGHEGRTVVVWIDEAPKAR